MASNTCTTSGCGKAASLRCPTCKELGLPGGFFCSKPCFQLSWEEHKKYHQALREALAGALAAEKTKLRLPKSFDGYEFTGRLRPAVVTPQMPWKLETTRLPDYALSGIPRSENALRGSNMIPVLTKEQQEAARRAAVLGREVLDAAAAALKVGATPDEIDKIVYAECEKRDIYPSPLNYNGFPKTVCVSVNEVICHGIPDTRPFEDGDIVNLDVSIYTKEGFHTDLNETYTVGNVDEKGRKLIKCAYECLAAAIAICKPGVMYRDVGTIVSRVAAEYGFSVVKSYCGHGIGELFHGAPNVPHYAKNKAVGIMRVGHLFTIEPMINEGTHGDELWPDNWTVVTRDGKRSAQFEHTLLVTETGVEILTARAGAPKDRMVWDEAAITRDAAGKSAETSTPAAGAGSTPVVA